jgi:hypothetical protein
MPIIESSFVLKDWATKSRGFRSRLVLPAPSRLDLWIGATGNSICSPLNQVVSERVGTNTVSGEL